MSLELPFARHQMKVPPNRGGRLPRKMIMAWVPGSLRMVVIRGWLNSHEDHLLSADGLQ
jgi:hypothetical protein